MLGQTFYDQDVKKIWGQYEQFGKLLNFVTGSYTGATNWNWQIFDALFRCSWLAEKLCTVIPEDMTDKWRVFKHDDPEITRIRTEFEEQNEIAALIQDVIMQSRLYGGAALLPIIKGSFNDEMFSQPFNMEEVKLGSLEGFQVLTKFDFMPLQGINRDIFINPKYYGDYLYYKIVRIQTMYQAGAAAGIDMEEPPNEASLPTIHVSRIIKFVGKRLFYYQKFFSGGWGDSVLTPLLDKLPAIDEAFSLIYSYFDEFNVDEYKIHNLSATVTNSAGDELFRKYKEFRERMKDTKLRFSDANDQLIRNQLGNISGLPPVFDTMINFVVAATGIPITRLLGTSIKGFGTGENELVQYYDLISQQQTKIKSQLKIIDEMIERHLFGKKLDIKYEFVSKRELTEQDKADIRVKNSQMYSQYVQMRVMTPQVVAENIKEEFKGMDDSYIATLEDDFMSYQEDMMALTSEDEEGQEGQENAFNDENGNDKETENTNESKNEDEETSENKEEEINKDDGEKESKEKTEKENPKERDITNEKSNEISISNSVANLDILESKNSGNSFISVSESGIEGASTEFIEEIGKDACTEK
jgi:phage-related protein (TIGR01555 family)